MSYSTTLISGSIDMDDSNYSGFNYFLVDASSGNITIALPSQTWDGNHLVLQRIDGTANTVSITADNGLTINSTTDISLAANQYVEIVSYETNWHAPIFNFTY